VPDHPDHEELAALQAGDGDRRQLARVAAHVAGCESCAEVVAAVERARGGLALLAEPELPGGLHDRLAEAVAEEAARSGPRRPPAWYRRPPAWGAAAAVLLLIALAVPLLNRSGENLTTASGDAGDAGGASAQETAGAPASGTAAAGLPVVRLPGEEVTPRRLQGALETDPVARQAYQRATADARLPGARGGEARSGDRQTAKPPAAATPSAPATSAAPGTPSATATQACLAAATAKAGRQLVPAFLAEGNYQGRPATVLVPAAAGDPSRTDMWVFPRDGCAGPPLATERLR
jgi:hypothetical protein